ncbi:cupin domain-containing protein (plasmid) [Rhizobium grahamii]|uniref:Cupin domain-containing protein n=1 Tax=Rhizobium grahamii TaxID=1120045 RepID=A0A5Q0CF41_9HYPH|nr:MULTISPECIES: XRE family transcriptional regulator [Rhizobium]QFY62567.1 cupin domain-containing protein [Rhizobium grahamii]QRM52693.1 cupin domain-containing protein [Rhizobium sp. BG6]
MSLGERLRDRRRELKLTLQQVADQAGFSVGFISQIERGITVPSLTSLVSVCRVLKVDVGSFFKPPRVDAPITRRETRPVYALGGTPGNSVTYERLSASFPGNILRSTLIHEPPGFRSEPMSHEGEEIFFIVEGSLTLEVDGEQTILEAGDSAHFPSSRTHVTWNHTTEPVTIFHTCTMDVFGDDVPSGEPETSLVVKRAATRRSAPKSLKINQGNKK